LGLGAVLSSKGLVWWELLLAVCLLVSLVMDIAGIGVGRTF